MNRFSSLMKIIFIFMAVNNVKNVSKIEEYSGIIREVYQFYKSSSIDFLYPGSKSGSSSASVNSQQRKIDQSEKKTKAGAEERFSKIKFLRSGYEHRIVVTPGENTFTLEIFTVFLLLSTNILKVHTNLARSDYPQLISDVHHSLGTSSVVIVHNDKIESITSMIETMKWLSNRGIRSLETTFRQLSEIQSYYKRRIKRDLYVVLLRNHESIKEFEKIMKKIVVSQPIWLVIFTPLNNEFTLSDYCINPLGNPFNVAFDTEMLVKCNDEEILQEWYSTYKNVTVVENLAKWNPINRLKFLNEHSLYRRRNNIGGVTLRIISVKGSHLVLEKEDKKLSGLFGDVIRELSISMNFKIKHTGYKNDYGSWKKNTGEWTGIIKEFFMNNADLGAADMIISTRRLGIVDFSIPLITTRVVLFFQEPSTQSVQELGYFMPFSNKIWMSIMILILATPILLTLIIKIKSKKTNDVANLLFENYLNVWGIYCQQGLPVFPTERSLRLAYFSIFISALIISSVYSAILISFLTLPRPNLPFTSLEGFVQDGTYKLIVLKDSAHQELFCETKDPLLKNMQNLMKNEKQLPINVAEAITQICSSKTAFFSTQITVDTENLPSNCKLTYISAGEINVLALPIKKGSQYTGIINYHILKFFNNGVIQRFRQKESQININENSNSNNNLEVTFYGVAPILFILITGVILSTLIFIFEKIYIFYHKKMQSKGEKSNRLY